MNHRFWGIKSIILAGMGLAIALTILFSYSIYWGLAYLGIILVCPLLIIYFYCTKCLCDGKTCAHYFLGKLSEFLPDKRGENYQLIDYIMVFISLFILTLFPQFILIKYRFWFILFWILQITAFIEILIFVCRGCENRKCLLCRNKR